jgi:hypothetical protein
MNEAIDLIEKATRLETKELVATQLYVPLGIQERKALDLLKKAGTQKGHYVASAIREKLIRDGHIRPEDAEAFAIADQVQKAGGRDE